VVIKASAGAIEYVPVCKVTNIVNTIKKLKDEGLWIAAVDMDGDVFYEQNMKGPLGLVIGSEGYGISRLVKENCDFKVKMPMVGKFFSFAIPIIFLIDPSFAEFAIIILSISLLFFIASITGFLPSTNAKSFTSYF